MMKVLIVGGGGREHALAWKMSQSARVGKIYCAPGNAGTASVAANVRISAEDIPSLLKFATEEKIDLTIVGPEDALCLGIVDAFGKRGLRIFGPTAQAARIEGDKGYAKQLMRQAAIPTAEGRVFENYRQAHSYVASRDCALVVKASGLAKGKGVVICEDPSKALRALEDIMVKKIFGPAGEKVVVEEKLDGPEVSIQALVDGRTIYVLESAQDYKRLGDGDAGPNTGGMGSVSPARVLEEDVLRRVYTDILIPVVDALNGQGCSYRGVLYAGLMLTAAGPKVLEFNCRLGDPETQCLLPRLKTDLVDVVEAVIEGRLEEMTLEWDPRPCVCVVLASDGYPGSHATGRVVTGLESARNMEDVLVFHAGTIRAGETVVSAGGRVLGVSALGSDMNAARVRAYQAAERISFEGKLFRRDIGNRI